MRVLCMILEFASVKIVLEDVQHRFWNRRGFDGCRFTFTRQPYCECQCMQPETVECVIAPEIVNGTCRPVAYVTDYRMPRQFRMAADLVCAA